MTEYNADTRNPNPYRDNKDRDLAQGLKTVLRHPKAVASRQKTGETAEQMAFRFGWDMGFSFGEIMTAMIEIDLISGPAPETFTAIN